ncbi:hypothetical protein [Actinobaculum massiliense]|uniref:hypothetical protein n=1 Tax=Actinobaculum massiliense TaxID=202789 RepID=UPI00254EC354|nr:hypothetical protein [Actinobaculum massiliense]MDK8319283.1 hypothetical protein [Actinobaculum massiliense]
MSFGKTHAEKKAQEEVDRILDQIDSLRSEADKRAKKAKLKGKFYSKRFERQAKHAASDVQEYAKAANEKLQDYAKQGYDWAAPRAQEIADKARPYLEEAADKARPYIEDAKSKAQPYIDDAKDAGSGLAEKVKNDYLPRAHRAWQAAADAARDYDGNVAETAKKVGRSASRELQTPESQKKRSRGGKVFGTLALVGGLGVAVYFLWKRSQPTEDPWAESYWADVDNPSEESADDDAVAKVADGAEDAAEKAGDVAEQAKEKAEDLADSAKDKAEDLADSAKESGKRAASTAQHAAEDGADKAQELADKAKDVVEDATENN